MRILISGASGFVGAALFPRLLEQGHEVRALAATATAWSERSCRYPLVNLSDFGLTIGDTVIGMRAASDARCGRGRLLPDPTDGGRSGRGALPWRASGPRPTRSLKRRERRESAASVYLGCSPMRGRAPHTFQVGTRWSASCLCPCFCGSAGVDRSRRALPLISLSCATGRATAGAHTPGLASLSHATHRRACTSVLKMLASCASVASVGGRSLDVGGPDVLKLRRDGGAHRGVDAVAAPSVRLGVTATCLLPDWPWR